MIFDDLFHLMPFLLDAKYWFFFFSWLTLYFFSLSNSLFRIQVLYLLDLCNFHSLLIIFFSFLSLSSINLGTPEKLHSIFYNCFLCFLKLSFAMTFVVLVMWIMTLHISHRWNLRHIFVNWNYLKIVFFQRLIIKMSAGHKENYKQM